MGRALRSIGMETRQQFLRRDPYKVYAELLIKVDPSLCRCALASLVGAKKGVKWHIVTKEAAAEFRRRYPSHEWANRC
ncbi:MAG: hypothetical protein GX455_05445 [Phycisphaerae bacterium]|nr:hypothetical protein [Phycisphaerae bacterium]